MIDSWSFDVTFDPRWHQVHDEIKILVNKGARDIEAIAKELVPRDLNFTFNSLLAREQRTGTWSIEWRIGTTTEYAPFLELGTWKMAARPYMTPAANVQKPIIERSIIDTLKRLGS